jgi:hypothetical protein
MGMTVNLTGASATTAGGAPTDLHRSGWAAIAAAAVFLIQPLSAAFLPFDLETIHDPMDLTRYWWAGTLQALEFVVMGTAVLVMVSALRRVWPASTLRDVTGAAGLVAGTGLLLEAALSAATYSAWLMEDTARFSDDPSVRGAVLFSTYVSGYAFLGATCVASAVWLVGVVAFGRRLRYLGTVMSVFAGIVAAALIVGVVTGFTIPTVILHVPLWLALGVRLLRARALPAAPAGVS